MKLDLQSRGAKVEFKNVGKQFGAVSAVSDCTFDIRAGEFFTLLGPSGSGKTTLLNMVAGFLDPSMGGIFIDGVCVTSIPTEKRNVGMVFQNYSLFPHMNVARNVAFPLKMRGVGAIETRKRVQYALSLVDLSEYENRMPSELSGGERQRSRLRGQSFSSPACCSWTNRLARLISNCGSVCSWRLSAIASRSVAR